MSLMSHTICIQGSSSGPAGIWSRTFRVELPFRPPWQVALRRRTLESGYRGHGMPCSTVQGFAPTEGFSRGEAKIEEKLPYSHHPDGLRSCFGSASLVWASPARDCPQSCRPHPLHRFVVGMPCTPPWSQSGLERPPCHLRHLMFPQLRLLRACGRPPSPCTPPWSPCKRISHAKQQDHAHALRVAMPNILTHNQHARHQILRPSLGCAVTLQADRCEHVARCRSS